MIKVLTLINGDKIIGFTVAMVDEEFGSFSLSVRNPFLIWQKPDGEWQHLDYVPESDKSNKNINLDMSVVMFSSEPNDDLKRIFNKETGMEKIVAMNK
jgi:hypothetical protein